MKHVFLSPGRLQGPTLPVRFICVEHPHHMPAPPPRCMRACVAASCPLVSGGPRSPRAHAPRPTLGSSSSDNAHCQSQGGSGRVGCATRRDRGTCCRRNHYMHTPTPPPSWSPSGLWLDWALIPSAVDTRAQGLVPGQWAAPAAASWNPLCLPRGPHCTEPRSAPSRSHGQSWPGLCLPRAGAPRLIASKGGVRATGPAAYQTPCCGSLPTPCPILGPELCEDLGAPPVECGSGALCAAPRTCTSLLASAFLEASHARLWAPPARGAELLCLCP